MSQTPQLDDCLRALEACGVPPARKLGQYMQLLLDWNEKINLTGARDANELAVKHVADVWCAVHALGGAVSPEIADIGSGGGIPGIILAILSPNTRVTLVERRQKKASVLDSISSHLELESRVRVIARSFEEIKNFSPDTEFWFRGFLPGPKLAVFLSENFPRANLGKIVLMKGPAWQQEKLDIMNQQKVKAGWLERFAGAAEIEYMLPKDAGQRTLVLV